MLARMGPAGERGEQTALRVSWSAVLASAAILTAAWMLDLFVLRTGMLAQFRGQPAVTPLYAFWIPNARPTAVLFLVAAAIAIAAAPRLTDQRRTRGATFAFASAAIGAACALALFLVRAPLDALGSNFDLYQSEEFWHDAARVQDVRAYLAHYVELMPQLSTHGRHFPPGYSLLLAGVDAVFGHEHVAAGSIVLASAAAALPATWLALRLLLTERAARQGTLLVALSPAFLDYACTSMDAVFLLTASVASWLALRSLTPSARPRDALLAGAALFLAANFSFSAVPLGFALCLGALLSRRSRAWKSILIAASAFASCALLVWLATGFAWWDCLQVGRANAAAFMDHVRALHEHTERWRMLYGNATAFVIGGAGCALVAVAGVRLARARVPRDAWTRALLLAYALLVALHFLETERIWLYTLPWLAAIALADGPLDDPSLRRLTAVAALQAFCFEVALFTLW